MKFTIQRKQLKALSRFSAIKDIRYYLQGIHVVQNNRGTYLESTNGHVLGRLLIDQTPVDGENSVIIPNDAVKNLAAIGKKGDETLHFTVDGIKITVIQPDNSTMQFSALDGTFPNCDSVMPKELKESDIKPSTFNPDYLMAFYDCASDLSGKKNPTGVSMSIMQRGDSSGIVALECTELFIGVIMPMRDNCINPSIPAWCKRPKVKALETESA
jgi:hypothetical protein